MIYRCSDKAKGHCKKDYYDRGIKVCKEWIDDFKLFRDWALENGYKKDLQIDRRDNDSGYSPGNCRWVTHTVNTRNSRVSKLTEQTAREVIILKRQGIKQKDIAEIYGVRPNSIGRVGVTSWLGL